MPTQTRAVCRNIIYGYMLTEGWLPIGTTGSNWDSVTMADLQMDDPPLPGDPHLQKKRISAELQNIFSWLGVRLRSPLSELKKKTVTLGDFADWCHSNHH